jgi:glucosyl-3-phosphoglycerate phosphatase
VTAGRLLLWRHGRTAYNAEARLQGQVDIPLDDVGRWQARTAAARMLERHEPTHVVTSDLTRAAETARFLGRAAEIDVILEPRVRERAFGDWEGLTGDEISVRWPDEFALWRAGGEPSRVGAESRARVAERMAAGIVEHAAPLGRTDTLVVVSHGAAISSAVGELLGMAPQWRGIAGMLNAHWAELVSSSAQGQASWRLAGYNLGPTDASSDWNAGPDAAHGSDADAQTRDPG